MSGQTWRMLPPSIVQKQTLSINGRTYSGTPGQVFDVIIADAQFLQSNGWIFVEASGYRPANGVPPDYLTAGVKFFDPVVGKVIVYDGANWRDPSTGASV